MSGRIKYGETYESIAQNITPYLNNCRYKALYKPSLYPRWWDATITIYNRYEDKETNIVKWYKNVLDNCFLKNADNKTIIGQTVLETNNIIARIPENENYKSFGEWINISSGISDYFTLRQGDIIVEGEIDDKIDEYAAGKRSSDLLSKYKEKGVCLVISGYQKNIGAGRIAPHYYVSGE